VKKIRKITFKLNKALHTTTTTTLK